MAWRGYVDGNYTTDRTLNLMQQLYNSDLLLTKKPSSMMEAISRRSEYHSGIVNHIKALGGLHSGYIPLDENGEPLAPGSKYYDPNLKKMTTVDQNRRVIITNEDHIKLYDAIEDDMEDKVDQLMEKCVKSNFLCATILNVTPEELVKQLEPNGEHKKTVDGEELEADILKVNGLPNSMKATAPGSKQYLFKLAKLRTYIQKRLPYVNLLSFNRNGSDANDPVVRDPATEEQWNTMWDKNARSFPEAKKPPVNTETRQE